MAIGKTMSDKKPFNHKDFASITIKYGQDRGLLVLLLWCPCTSMGKGLFPWCPLGLEIEAFQKGMQNYVCMYESTYYGST